jgi:hypothetical protein
MTVNGLLIGRTFEKKIDIGFGNRNPLTPSGNPIVYTEDGHLMTIAPTGAGKGVSCVIPALVHYEGSTVTLDLKGENYIMTRRRRTELGMDVHCLDPFGTVRNLINDETLDKEFCGFNPFDLLPYLSTDESAAARILAEMIMKPEGLKSDPFWRDASVNLLAALIQLYNKAQGPSRSLSSLIHDLYTDAPGFTLGKIGPITHIKSVMYHDSDLYEKFEKSNFTVEQILAIYQVAREDHEASTADLYQNDNKKLAKLIKKVIKQQKKDTKKSLNKIIKETLPDADAQTHYFIFFEMMLEWDVEKHFTNTDIVKIYKMLTTPFYGFENHQQRPKSGIADDAFPLEMIYPLAIHRLAQSTKEDVYQAALTAASAPDKTWSSILVTLKNGVSEFSGRNLAKFLSGSYDFEKLLKGENISTYIAFPPSKIRAHPMLFRLLVEGLMNVTLHRDKRPEKATLFLLDEVAQLGRMEFLITAKTLLRGYGVQVWSFWQDVSQLQSNYPLEWRTLLNNSRVIQIFGRNMSGQPTEIYNALGFSADALVNLDTNNMLAWVDSPHMKVLQRPISYLDSDTAPHCDPGPFRPDNTYAPKTTLDILDPEELFHEDEALRLLLSKKEVPSPEPKAQKKKSVKEANTVSKLKKT